MFKMLKPFVGEWRGPRSLWTGKALEFSGPSAEVGAVLVSIIATVVVAVASAAFI